MSGHAWMLPVALALATAISGCAKQEPAPPVVRPVVLAPVSIGGDRALGVFAGEVKPRNEAELAFRIGGKIVERRAEVGDSVKRGQVLARLDPADLALQAQSAEAALAAAQTEQAFAQAELERYRNLRDKSFVSASALDQKASAASAAASRLDQARAALAVTRNQAGYATLVANENGVITAIHAESGQVVAAGQAVMRLARTEEREVVIAVPENRIDEIRQAQRVDVALVSQREHRYTGHVREIAPAVDPVTRTFAVRVAVPEAGDALGWGMSANVIVHGKGDGSSALVPSTAIYHDAQGKPAVWVFDPQSSKVGLRPVELGMFREDGVLVARGLTDGEWVVAAGVNKLEPGQQVRPYEQPGAATPSGERVPPKAVAIR